MQEQLLTTDLLSEMKHRFDETLNKLCSSKGHNTQILTKPQYFELIEKVKTTKSKVVGKKPEDYQRLRRFDIITVGENEKLIVPTKEGKEQKQIRFYVHREEIFQLLHEAHMAIGHGGRNRMEKELNLKYKNITREMIVTYLNLCKTCENKHSVPKESDIMELKRKESLRRLMLHHYQNGKNSVETATAICESLGKDAITQRTVSRWFQRFKEGDFKLSDHDRCDKETININQLKSLLEKGTAPQQIAKEMGVPRKTILEYITKMKSKKVKNNKADNKQQQINNNSEEGNKNEEVTDSVAEENEVIKPIEVCNIKMEMPYEFETENGVEDSIQPHVIIKEEPHLVNQENVQYPAPQFVTVPMNNVVQEEEEQQQQQPLLKVLRSETVKDIRQVKHDLLNKQTFLTTPMLIRKRGRKRKLSNESGVKTKIIINNENNSNEVDPLRGDLKLTKNISAATNDGLSSNDNSVSTKQRRKSEEKSKSKQEKIIPTKQKSLLKLKPLNKVSTSSNNVLEHNSLLSCFEHTALQNPSITIIPLYVNGQNEPVKEPDTVISNKDINVVNVKNDKNKNCDNQEDKDKNKEKKKEIGKSHRVAMTEYEFKMYNLYKKKVEIAMQHEKERHEKAMKMYQLLLDKIESSKFNIKQILDADCEF